MSLAIGLRPLSAGRDARALKKAKKCAIKQVNGVKRSTGLNGQGRAPTTLRGGRSRLKWFSAKPDRTGKPCNLASIFPVRDRHATVLGM